MCGRTAQTLAAVRAAADILGAPQPRETAAAAADDGAVEGRNDAEASSTNATANVNANSSSSSGSKGDNYNLSPGMDAIVFYKNKDGELVSESKVWGLITKHGSTKNPLQTGMGQHFSALMYNARSDTLFIKQTFGNLISKHQSCIVAVDGWFEWKQEVKGKKQPFFVKAKNQPYTLFPGLWAKVPTGRSEEPYLTTFTILTTEAAPCLTWLHSRMPVCCFDLKLARAWLDAPTQGVHEALLENNYSSPKMSCSDSNPEVPSSPPAWEWHAVTDEMTNLKFRSPKAIEPWKRPTIQHFFLQRNAAASDVTNSSCKMNSTASSPYHHNNNETGDSFDFVEQKDVATSSSSIQTFSTTQSQHVTTPTKRGSIAAFLGPSPGFNKAHFGGEDVRKSQKRPTATQLTSQVSKKSKKTTTSRPTTTTTTTKGSIAAFFSPKTNDSS